MIFVDVQKLVMWNMSYDLVVYCIGLDGFDVHVTRVGYLAHTDIHPPPPPLNNIDM